jgi:hypothetical protein
MYSVVSDTEGEDFPCMSCQYCNGANDPQTRLHLAKIQTQGGVQRSAPTTLEACPSGRSSVVSFTETFLNLGSVGSLLKWLHTTTTSPFTAWIVFVPSPPTYPQALQSDVSECSGDW